MDSGYMKQIRKRILAAEDGTTFATSDFADIADSATVRQSLNRLVQAGILQRVLRGIFVKPKFCSTLKSRCCSKNFSSNLSLDNYTIWKRCSILVLILYLHYQVSNEQYVIN